MADDDKVRFRIRVSGGRGVRGAFSLENLMRAAECAFTDSKNGYPNRCFRWLEAI
jgi:hypothetical protein